MSFTNSDFILGALQDIGILAEVDTAPSAEQGTQGLAVLNNMMFEWEALGVDLQYSQQSSTADDCPIDVRDRQVVRANLALRLADSYGVQPRSVTASLANTGLSRLLRDSVLAQQVERSMSNMPVADDQALHLGQLPGTI